MNKEKQAFLDILAQDRYDEATRRVFSDWLEEHDFPEEAEFQRKWTREWQEADDWMRNFASNAGQTCTEGYGTRGKHTWKEITYEDLIQAGWDYVKTGDFFTQMGSENLRNDMFEPKTRELFWKHWSTVTGIQFPLERPEGLDEWEWRGDRPGNPFSCSC